MKLSILMSSRIAISCFCLSLSSPSSCCNQGNSVPCMLSQNCDSVLAKKDMVISSVCFVVRNVILTVSSSSPCLFFFQKATSPRSFARGSSCLTFFSGGGSVFRSLALGADVLLKPLQVRLHRRELHLRLVWPVRLSRQYDHSRRHTLYFERVI